MTIAEILLLDYDAEIQNTRRILERIPDNAQWKPHEKSMPIGRLAVHVARLPDFATTILTINSPRWSSRAPRSSSLNWKKPAPKLVKCSNRPPTNNCKRTGS
jgi:hypothetical protein